MAHVVDAPRGRAALAGVLLAGCAVAVALGSYAKEHTPVPQPLFLAGFSGALQFKTWFATIALLLVLVQVLTAMWMWGRLPGASVAPAWVGLTHRWSGAVAFAILIPVALNCLYSLGFSTLAVRPMLHSIAGCVFYGGYASKMLSLRIRGLPRWLLPLLGGLVFTAFMVLWFTSAAWFFTSSGRPLR
ncbi:MAG: hypothetical protein QOK15_2198 [Nocardioidaceae bacterium]|jgi:hypothetical protein|nr:hypothetical protein [Nocardioidaceae bacterium]